MQKLTFRKVVWQPPVKKRTAARFSEENVRLAFCRVSPDEFHSGHLVNHSPVSSESSEKRMGKVCVGLWLLL